MSKVSICIPAYENRFLFQRLLNSIFIQSYTDFEIIVSDDSKTNEIEKFVREFKTNKLNYFKHCTKNMPSENWNNMLSKCTGKYIKIMFHDDFFTNRESLEEMINLVETGDYDFAFCGTNQVSGSNTYSRCISAKHVKYLRKNINYLYCGNWIGAPSATIFKNQDVMFDECLCWLVDLEFYLNYLNRYKKFNYSVEPLISIGIHENQTTNSVEKNAEINLYEYSYVYQKYHLEKYNFCKKKLKEIKWEFVSEDVCKIKKLSNFINLSLKKIKRKIRHFIELKS